MCSRTVSEQDTIDEGRIGVVGLRRDDGRKDGSGVVEVEGFRM